MQNLYFPIQKEYEISRNFSEIFNILKIPSFFKAKADKQLLSFKYLKIRVYNVSFTHYSLQFLYL